METLTWNQVRAWRVGRHHLSARVPLRRMLNVVSEVCGVHAQVTSSAELQLWARVEGLRQEHVRKALWERRTLVRTWAMRGTLHLLTAADLPLYVAALRTHDRWWKGAWLKFIGMKEDELRALLETIRDSLGAKPITRAELAKKVAARAGSGEEERMLSNWGEMLKPVAFHGWLISGPPQGQNVTFVRPNRWLRTWKEPEPNTPWPEIVRGYLRAYGPATREEFGRWWGMQAAPAGRILNASADELMEVDVEGHRSWARPEDVREIQRASIRGSVRLLPAFDVYTTGARPKDALVDRRFESRVYRQAGWVSPVVLIDGAVAGVWSHDRSGDGVDVTVESFRRLSASQKNHIEREADRLGAYYDAPASVSYGPVRS